MIIRRIYIPFLLIKVIAYNKCRNIQSGQYRASEGLMDKHIFKNLSWNASLDGQKEAINKLALMDNLNPSDLIQPQGKEYWENAARALYLIGYPRIEEAIPGLFKWIQDLNWPGALIVMELLKSLPKEVMIRHLESASLDAFHSNDDIWLLIYLLS